ncbi:hypothetical protein THC_1195 [Caldimicrobium thiodismutans]|uniref:Glycosyl transferase family 1 domain-containing protein n=1 Tax=Caldimicrobium thiodismutans TaxID=1653476 RepID=A0A0U5AY25_9BACT|nr:glycosyltransferase family 4 protein [Caldimicrobium thiodismutans]BAU23566.1 hypothetical protein THC_1195 [Caldimicrobium thiodismutans]
MPLINFRLLPKKESNEADFIYTWGYIPILTKKNFIIEFDNPYVVTFYNKKAFGIYKSLFKKFFNKAYKLTFMSQTSMEHFLYEIGEQYRHKCFIVYPFVERNYLKKKKDINKKTINFTFAGFDFRLNGGPELLKAFSSIKNKNLKLFIFSQVPKEIRKEVNDDRIIINTPINRQDLINHLLTTTDILILPTFYESFPIVILEALSSGCGIIITNVYATHEMVESNKNGILLSHPFLKPDNYNGFEFVNNTVYRINEFTKNFLENKFYDSFSLEIAKAIEIGAEEYKNWQQGSIELYENKFSKEIWLENFKKIFS